jgi:hypothetical protein
MTLQQTVTIPADRRLYVDWTLPETASVGPATAILDFPAVPEIIASDRGKEAMLAAIDAMCGLYAGMESPGAYLERHHSETELEWEIEESRRREREQWKQ